MDAGELARVQDVVEKDYSDRLAVLADGAAEAFERARQRGEPDIGCPRCGRPLVKTEVRYGAGVLVDLCPGCGGAWLDRGELQALEVFAERVRRAVHEEEAREDAEREVRRGFLVRLRRLLNRGSDA